MIDKENKKKKLVKPIGKKKIIIGIISLIIVAVGSGLYFLAGASEGLEAKPLPLADSELEIMTNEDGVEFVRTPDEFFENLPDWSYEAKYIEIDGLRQAYYEAGPEEGETILLLHGQPTWSYLYRKMIPSLADAGYHVIALDNLGFGQSDKPIDLEYHSYVDHVERTEAFIQKLGLDSKGITAFVQDWGSLIGLNVIGNNPEWFDRVIMGNGTLPELPEGSELPVVLNETPEEMEEAANRHHAKITKAPASMPKLRKENGEYTLAYKLLGSGGDYNNDRIIYGRYDERFRVDANIEAGTFFALTPEERAAYAAPFPARITMAAPRVFPGLINDTVGKTDLAWEGLRDFDKPFLTIIGCQDTGTLGSVENQDKFIEAVPGAKGQPHTRLMEASHFIQDDQGEEVARLMIEFIEDNPME